MSNFYILVIQDDPRYWLSPFQREYSLNLLKQKVKDKGCYDDDHIETLPNTTVSEDRPHIRHRAVMRHGEVGDGGLGREVRRLRRAVGRHARPRRPARAAAGLHDRSPPARGAQERRADGRP